MALTDDERRRWDAYAAQARNYLADGPMPDADDWIHLDDDEELVVAVDTELTRLRTLHEGCRRQVADLDAALGRMTRMRDAAYAENERLTRRLALLEREHRAARAMLADVYMVTSTRYLDVWDNWKAAVAAVEEAMS